MEKKTFLNMDLEMYVEKLENGLTIYVVPMKNINNIFVNFSTDYGSVQRQFVPLGEAKMVKLPDGIAHFLEHKMFEQPDGIDPFTFYSERGSLANANTNNLKTSYLFSGPNFFKENLNYLLDYVQKPHFTDENVEKEKGIITQEIKMYKDEPYTVLFEGLIYNLIVNHPLKYPVIGTIKSINSITKENLYTCYKTFYNPSNMFVTITGNVNPEEALNIIKENQSKKTFPKAKPIKTKEYNEPDKVAKEKEVKKMNVTIPKIGIGYKFNITNIKLSLRKIYYYLTIFFDIKLGPTSTFLEEMKNQNILNDGLEIYQVDIESHMTTIIIADCEKVDLLVENIEKHINDFNIDEEELNRKKKTIISTLLYISENVFSINSKIMNNLVKYKKVYTDDAQIIKNLNIDEFNNLLHHITFENRTIYIVNPKK